MKPYDTEQDKKEQVREMFDRIAPAYDRLNHTLSFQIDKLWRRHVVRIVRRMQPRRILDVATGTGDLALAMARRMRGVQVSGVDLSENMLAEARRKAPACGLDERVVLSLGDAERLEVADASVDVVTVAFGVRNFGDLGAGLREIARVLRFPAAMKLESFSKGRLELVEYRLPDFPWLENITLVELYKKIKTKFLICAVQRDEKVFIPSGDFALQEGDRIHVAASHRNIERFFRASGFMKDKVRTVMIVGGGRVGYYLSKQLLAVGMKVKLIEKDRERCEKLSDLLPKAIVICGDGTDQDLLIEEGVLEVDGFVALTGIDEENMIISLFAKDSTNAKVVTKVSRENYIDLSSELGLDCVVSPKSLTMGNVLSYVRSLESTAGSEIESLYHLVGDQVEAIEFRVKERIPDLVGVPLKDVQLKKNILICAIIRKREIIIPDGSAVIELGDSVVIVSKEHHFSSMKDILD